MTSRSSLRACVPAAFAGILLINAAAPVAALEDVACAAPTVTDRAVVPGGDGALAATQPGPAPAAQPGRCWQAAVSVSILAPDAVMSGSVVVVADDVGEAVALAAADGTEAWRYAVADEGEGNVHGLAAGASAILVAGPDGLTSLEPADGTRQWRYRVSSEGLIADSSGFFWPVVQGDAVYGLAYSTEDDVTWDRRLVALDAASGDERWTAPLPGTLALAPSSDGSIVVLAGGDGSLAAYRAATGEEAWSADAQALGAQPATRPAIGDGVVIEGLADGSAVALDATTGTVAWRHPSESGTVVSVSVVGPVALVGGATTLTAVDAATGTVSWSVPVQSSAPMFPFASIPSAVEDALFVGTTDAMDVAYVLALDLASGTERWRVDTGAYGAAFSPLVAGGRIYLSLWDVAGTSGLLALGDEG